MKNYNNLEENHIKKSINLIKQFQHKLNCICGYTMQIRCVARNFKRKVLFKINRQNYTYQINYSK